MGRYLRADPIGLSGGINPFIYIENNPLVGKDPYGLKKCSDCDQCPCGTWTTPHSSFGYGGFLFFFAVETLHLRLDCDCSSASVSFMVTYYKIGAGSAGGGFQGIFYKVWGACNSNEIKFGGFESSGGTGYGILGGSASASGGFDEGSASGGLGFGLGGFASFGSYAHVVK